MKKIILIMISFLLFTSCSLNDHYKSNLDSTIGDASLGFEESQIPSDEETLKILKELSKKVVDFNSFLQNMAEYGAYNIDPSKTFMKNSCMYAEYNPDDFFFYQQKNNCIRFEKEIYSFTSLEEIETYILSFFISVEDSSYSQIVSRLFITKDEKLFYNTNEESVVIYFPLDLETVSIIDKSKTKIILSANHILSGNIITFTMVKNINGAWRLTKDIYGE